MRNLGLSEREIDWRILVHIQNAGMGVNVGGLILFAISMELMKIILVWTGLHYFWHLILFPSNYEIIGMVESEEYQERSKEEDE